MKRPGDVLVALLPLILLLIVFDRETLASLSLALWSMIPALTAFVAASVLGGLILAVLAVLVGRGNRDHA